MNQKKAKAIRKQFREEGREITSIQGRHEYRAAKRAAAAPVEQFIKPLPNPHSSRTAEARAHAALPKDSRNQPWRTTGALIVASHPQRERRPGRKHFHMPEHTDPMLRFQAFGGFAKSFIAGMAAAASLIGARYQKRAARGR